MNENVGASFGLSVLIVGFFAVALYQPETPRPPIAAVPSAPPAAPVDARPPDAPPLTPVVRSDRPPPAPVPRPVSRRQAPGEAAPVEPRGAFTRVREGETLADVARRVYGAGGALNTLWRANRDRLDGPDSPVAPGSVLRTP